MATKEETPLRNQYEKREEETKTLKEKITYIYYNISVEPVLVAFTIAGVLGKLATQNLNLDKACRVNLKYGDKVCDALIAKTGTFYRNEELAVQELIASMEAWKTFVLTAIPSLLILFIGAWSDRTGNRKICILLPITGELLSCLCNILNVYFFYEIPVEVNMFMEAIFPAVTGGWISLFLGSFSYISDISSEETRTFRVGIACLCLTAGTPIGTAFSGILIKYAGYYGVFGITMLLFCFSMIVGFIYIERPEKPINEAKKKNSSFFGFLKSFFDIRHVKDTLTVAFKSGPNQRRMKSILVLMSISFVFGTYCGENTIRYLFTRYRFNWDAVKFSFYNTFNIVIHAIGCLIAISVFSRRWQWGDPTLGLISSVSKIIGGIAIAFSRNSTDMYIAVVLEMFNGISFTALRSMSSKLASGDEYGKMIAVFNLIEVLTSMVYGPLYSWIYMISLKIDSCIIFYFSSVLTIMPIIFYTWFYRQEKEDAARNKTEKMNNLECVKE